MPEYVLVNRRSGKFTNTSKLASRATVLTTLGMLTSARIVSDHRPEDPLARHVVLLDADPEQVATMRKNLPADSILEPAVRRGLHHRIPIELQSAIPHTASPKATGTRYNLTVTAGGAPLPYIDVMLYLRDPGGQVQNTTVKSDANGKLSFTVPNGFQIAFVEPIPYAGFWIMLAEAPSSGSTIECLQIAKAKTGGKGWCMT